VLILLCIVVGLFTGSNPCPFNYLTNLLCICNNPEIIFSYVLAQVFPSLNEEITNLQIKKGESNVSEKMGSLVEHRGLLGYVGNVI
jgi:hypothetical protein